MGAYAKRKLEYLSSPGAFRIYTYFLLPVYIITLAVVMTWRATVTGYLSPVVFTLDVVSLGLAIASFMSMSMMDLWTPITNMVFLVSQIAINVYATLSSFSVMDAAAKSVGAVAGGMMDGANALAQNSIQTASDLSGGAFPDATNQISSSTSVIFGALSDALADMLKTSANLVSFLSLLFCEIFVVICMTWFFKFVINWTFFKTPLSEFRKIEDF